MKRLHTLFLILFFAFTGHSQLCVDLDSWTFVSDNGDGTCNYDLVLIVDSGNGASGTATFMIDGATVHVEPACTCNPSPITFQVTVPCQSVIDVTAMYDAPGNGNDCSGSTGEIVLPIEWRDIGLRNEGSHNVVFWSTLWEINNKEFVIEHADLTEEFYAIGVVGGSGDASESRSYEFTHNKPSHGINYYRIQQVDFDGSFSYSEILSTKNIVAGKIQTFPNPFLESIYIEMDSDMKWELLDVYGSVVLSGYSREIKAGSLSAGSYILRIIDNGVSQLQRVVKL